MATEIPVPQIGESITDLYRPRTVGQDPYPMTIGHRAAGECEFALKVTEATT